MTPSQQINDLYHEWKSMPAEQQRRASSHLFGALSALVMINDRVPAADLVFAVREAMNHQTTNKP